MLTANKLVQRTLNTVKVANGVIWQPDPDNAPQCLAYEMAMQVDELGYGGQAGGGKTDLILGLAGTKFRDTMILRREFPQLRNIIKRGNTIYPTSFVSGERKEWAWEGHTIGARSMPHADNWEKYQGNPVDLLAVDEAAQFPEIAVRLVGAWVRAEPGRKTLKVFTFNPPTTLEGQWVIDYFRPWLDPQYPNPAEPGEIRYFAFLPDKHGREHSIEVDNYEPFVFNGEKKYPISRTYIPASRHDNKHLDEEYERTLDNLPEPYRTMLKTGSMDIKPQDNEWQIIPAAWVLAAQERWEAMRPKDSEKVMTALGVDVARGGKDNTVLAPLYGVWFDEVVVYPGTQTPNGAIVRDYVLKAHRQPAKIGIDVVSWGSSAYDHLKPLRGLKVYGLNAGAGGKGTDNSKRFKFKNLRARMWWRFREALDPDSPVTIALPPDQQLFKELTAPLYKAPKDVIIVEQKEDIKSRLGVSPDKADAVIMAWEVRSHTHIQIRELY